jgi:hypothetical protein
VLTFEGASADSADQDKCNQDTYVVRADVGDEPSCDEESSTHPHDDGNDGDRKAEHGDIYDRSRCIADRFIWIAKGRRCVLRGCQLSILSSAEMPGYGVRTKCVSERAGPRYAELNLPLERHVGARACKVGGRTRRLRYGGHKAGKLRHSRQFGPLDRSRLHIHHRLAS